MTYAGRVCVCVCLSTMILLYKLFKIKKITKMVDQVANLADKIEDEAEAEDDEKMNGFFVTSL